MDTAKAGEISLSHWSTCLVEITASAHPEDGYLRLPIGGGADNGKFCLITDDVDEDSLIAWSGHFLAGDILMEVQDHQVSGYTLLDVVTLVETLSRNGNPLLFKMVRGGSLPKNLRTFLSSRFLVGSRDHQLQQVVRDNLYLRTVPCTTRAPRAEEVEGQDYNFVSIDEYLAMERGGLLLESGVYEGNHYGTPRPAPASSGLTFDHRGQLINGPPPSPPTQQEEVPKSLLTSQPKHQSLLMMTSDAQELASPHNNEAAEDVARVNFPAAAKEIATSSSSATLPRSRRGRSMDAEGKENEGGGGGGRNGGDSTASSPGLVRHSVVSRSTAEHLPDATLATLAAEFAAKIDEGPPVTAPRPKKTPPPPPERRIFNRSVSTGAVAAAAAAAAAEAEQQEARFEVSMRAKRRSPVRTASGPLVNSTTSITAAQDEDQLPYGWERVEDEDFGVFYIDHINKTTQYDRPSAGDATDNKLRMDSTLARKGILVNGHGPAPESMHPPAFTTDPDELEGRVMRTTLVKSPRGLGFTIVGSGGETTSGQETPTDSPRSQSGGRTLLQIRSITPGGPAAVDGVLTSGDVLVFVGSTCVLGHTHADVVKLFQGISVGATVTLTVSRGYALPALDSDTQVITTSAVGPDSPSDFLPSDGLAVEFVRVHLLKAATGFGFTVADCDQGQRIKQIVDQSRCRLLREGDILVEVDDKRVKEMSHLAVVQLLKECPVAKVTRILVQRQRPPSGPRPRPISTSGLDPEPRKPPIASAPPPERSSLIHTDSNGHATNGRPKPEHQKSVTIITPPSSTSHHAATVLRPSQCPVPLPKSTSEPLPSKPTIRRLPATSVSECMGRPKPGQVVRGPSLTIKPSKSFDNSAPAPKSASSSSSPFGGLAASRRLLSGSSHQLFSALRQRTRTPERSRPASMLVEEPKAPAALAETDDGEETTTTEDGDMDATDAAMSTDGREPRDLRFRMLRGPNGFGFRLVGGAEEGTAITVGSIVAGGAAEKDGRLLCGDELLAVDNVTVVGASHHRAVQLMDGRPQVILTVRRWASSPSARLRRASLPAPRDRPPSQQLVRSEPVDVQLRRHPGASGFGFSLIPSTAQHSPGALIEIVEMIQPMSAADLCGRIRPGDRLLTVNGVEVIGLQHKEVIARIERAGRDLQLRLLPGIRANSSSSSMTNGNHAHHPHNNNNNVNINNNNNEDFYEKRSMTLGRSKSSDRSGGMGGQLRLCVSTPKIERRGPSPDRSVAKEGGGGGAALEIYLRRGPRGFGFSIRGGWEFNRMPLFILRIADSGAAMEDGRMKVGDRILSINGRSTSGMTHAEAVALIQAQRSSIRLRLVRDVPEAAS